MQDRRRVHAQRVGGGVTTRIAWESEKLDKPDKISTQRDKRRTKTNRRATRCYTTLDAGLAPDCPGLRGRESLGCTRLTKAEKWRESKMIRCLEMAPTRLAQVEKRVETKMIQCFDVALYQSPESKTNKKQFSEDKYLALCVHLSHLRLSFTLSFRVIQGNKRGRLYFYSLALLLFFPVYNIYNIKPVTRRKGSSYLSRESEQNSTTAVQTCLLQHCSSNFLTTTLQFELSYNNIVWRQID